MSHKDAKDLPIVGNTAPEFELPDTDMQMRKLSKLRGTKTVLAFSLERNLQYAQAKCVSLEIHCQTFKILVQT